jgi:hypothetical protein
MLVQWWVKIHHSLGQHHLNIKMSITQGVAAIHGEDTPMDQSTDLTDESIAKANIPAGDKAAPHVELTTDKEAASDVVSIH